MRYLFIIFLIVFSLYQCNAIACDDDITNGIDWLLFSYAFIIVGFSSMLGRVIKSILDLIKYG